MKMLTLTSQGQTCNVIFCTINNAHIRLALLKEAFCQGKAIIELQKLVRFVQPRFTEAPR